MITSQPTKAEDFKAFRSPDAITETFEIPGTDLVIEIAGVKKLIDRKAVFANIEHYQKLKKWPISGPDSEVVDPEEWSNACWTNACVQSPALSVEEWLEWGRHNVTEMVAITNQCLIDSRLVIEKKTIIDDKGKSEEIKIPNGIGAAANAIEEPGKAEDPFTSV